jgi:hypothetical protein
MQPKSSGLRYVDTGHSEIQYSYSSCHSGINIQLNVSPLLLVVYRQIDVCYTSHLLPNTCIISGIRYVNSGPRQIQYNYISWYSGFNIQLNVNPSIFVKCPQCNARYTPPLQPHAAKILHITLSQHWPQSNPIKLHFFIFSLQYSIEPISVDIGDISTNQCALYSTFAVKYRAQLPVYGMPSLVPVKSNIITFLDIQATMFNWMYLRVSNLL